MQMDLKLNISQKQKLILTQTMKQSINILQMSAYELREYIDKKIEENPMLEGELDFVESKEKIDNSQLYKYLEGMYSENYNCQYNNEHKVAVFNFIYF